MKKYKYRIFDTLPVKDLSYLLDFLNDKGNDGWEVISYSLISEDKDFQYYQILMKKCYTI